MTPSDPPLLYLNAADVRACEVDASRIADRFEAMLTARAGVHSLPKTGVTPGDGRLFETMLAMAEPDHAMAVKAVGLVPGRAAQGLPTVSTLVLLFDTASGVPVAVVDGGEITATRTAAMSLTAARRLADPRSRVLGLVGAGVQAKSHLRAFAAEFPLEQVLVRGRSRGGVEAFLAHARAAGFDAREAESPAALLAASDIVVSSVPRAPDLARDLDAGALRRGSFACMADMGRTWTAGSLERFDVLCIDDHAQERVGRAQGHGILPREMPCLDLRELLADGGPRHSATARQAFDFRGMALADLAAVLMIHEVARARGLGTPLPR